MTLREERGWRAGFERLIIIYTWKVENTEAVYFVNFDIQPVNENKEFTISDKF